MFLCIVYCNIDSVYDKIILMYYIVVYIIAIHYNQLRIYHTVRGIIANYIHNRHYVICILTKGGRSSNYSSLEYIVII